jgi:hypothetical protein
MSAAKFNSMKDDDHLIIFLAQIFKGVKGRDCHVVSGLHDGEERMLKIL